MAGHRKWREPRADEIAKKWLKDHADEYSCIQAYNGFDYIGSPSDGYTYVWLEAYVDNDLRQHYLLDVRTKQPSAEWEDRTYLYVSHSRQVWHDQKISFTASHEDHVKRFLDGMKWFAEQITLDEG